MFQPSRDVLLFSNETGKKQLPILVKFGWIQPESPRYYDKFSTMFNNLFGNTARKVGISHKLVRVHRMHTQLGHK